MGRALLVAGVLLAGYRAAGAQALAERIEGRLGAEPRDALRPLVARFYEQRGHQPAWVSDSGASRLAPMLLTVVESAGVEGLDPDDYPHARIRGLLGWQRDADSLAEFDVLLTRALLAYGSDLSRGRIDPAAVDSPWTAAPRPADVVAALDPGAPLEALQWLAPPQREYALLRRTLQRYRDLGARGGWPAVPAGPELAPGTGDPRVAVLRARLIAEGDLAPGGDSAAEYDSATAQAVRQFQTRHGLEPDGVVGAGTRAALNVPVERKIHQIELNMERWRWLPRSLGQRYVMVNSAAFALTIVDSARPVLAMRAIVGRPDWPTPIVSGQMTGVIFSPVWNVPRSIALEEVLPLIRQDSRYLAQQEMSVYADSARSAGQVDPGTIDWAAMTEETFNLQLRQAPGGDNPLGGVKAIFGSRFNVCIHDTPVRSLFRERVRAFSHGCIRVDRAADLATYLLQDSLHWTADSVRDRMARPTEQVVFLSRPIPVHLSYWTAWVDDDGAVEFRDDVYGWDARLAAALANRRVSRSGQLRW